MSGMNDSFPFFEWNWEREWERDNEKEIDHFGADNPLPLNTLCGDFIPKGPAGSKGGLASS